VGIGLLSNNLLSNVQAALTLQQSHPNCRLAVLAHAMEASDQLGRLLGGISVISGVDLAADALVATAFGERVEQVLQIHGQNQLVVRYRVEPNDHLCGLTIARVENGYGMTVLRHQRRHLASARALPPLDWSPSQAMKSACWPASTASAGWNAVNGSQRCAAWSCGPIRTPMSGLWCSNASPAF